MMFELIMNMPVRSSNTLVHRIICSHSAQSLEEFTEELESVDFLIVEEWYPDERNEYQNHGPIALNHRYIGKIKVWSKQ